MAVTREEQEVINRAFDQRDAVTLKWKTLSQYHELRVVLLEALLAEHGVVDVPKENPLLKTLMEEKRKTRVSVSSPTSEAAQTANPANPAGTLVIPLAPSAPREEVEEGKGAREELNPKAPPA